MTITDNRASADATKIDIQFDPTVQRMEGIARHGNTPFDTSFITEILPGLWQGGCESGLILPEKIKNVVSLYPWENYKITHEIDSFLSIRMYDSEDQAFEQIQAIADWARKIWQSGGTVLIHCQAGLNRSSLVTAKVLIDSGYLPHEAISIIREKRSPACLCNKSFERWILKGGKTDIK